MIRYQSGMDLLARIPVEKIAPSRIGPKPIQEINGETLHPFLEGAIFKLWQVPDEKEVWVNQDPSCRPKNQEVCLMTGFLATEGAIEVGAYLGSQAECLTQAQTVEIEA